MNNTMRYLLLPATSFTKICVVASGSAEEAREDTEEIEEKLLERMLAVVDLENAVTEVFSVRSIVAT